MLTSTLALFTRSLRIDARTMQAHIIRLLCAAWLLLSLILSHVESMVLSAPGLHLFSSITYLNFLSITLGGIGFFATAISEEKEEDSLGLLQMAGISPAALLLGKSTTRMVSVLFILAVQFPFVLLSITLGGVTSRQVFAMSLALAAYMVFVANLGLTCSVICSTARRAATLMTVFMAGLLIVLPICEGLLDAYRHFDPASRIAELGGTLAGWIGAISVHGRIEKILGSAFNESAASPQVVFHLSASVALFAFSWATFERFTRERHASGRLEKVFVEPFQKGRMAGERRAWQSSLMWKDFYFIAGGKRMAIVRSILYVALIGGLSLLQLLADGGSHPREVVGGTAMVSMVLAGILELSVFASRVFREEVKARTLPLLVMLPMTLTDLAWSKSTAALPAILPVLICFLLGAVIYPEGLLSALGTMVTNSGYWYAAVSLVAFLFLTAYLSLVVKWGALPLALFAIYVYHILLVSCGGLLLYMVRSNSPELQEFMIFVPLIGLGVAVIFLLGTRIARRLEKLAGN